jgi:DNA-binding CsgD family transcriptional regulator
MTRHLELEEEPSGSVAGNVLKGSYHARCERRGNGWLLWLTGPGLTEQLVTQARHYDEVEDVAREMLAFVTQMPAESINVVVELSLQPELQHAVEKAHRLRRRLADLQRQSAAATQQAVHDLIEAGYSQRDAASILGLSRQRVSQLLQR